jgi:hypothetical protein
MFKKAVQRGRSERRGEAYYEPYVEPLSDARTKLADFFNSLLIPTSRTPPTPHPIERERVVALFQVWMLTQVLLDRRIIRKYLRAPFPIFVKRQIMLSQYRGQFRIDIVTHLVHLLGRRPLSVAITRSTLKIVRHHLADLNAGVDEFLNIRWFRS